MYLCSGTKGICICIYNLATQIKTVNMYLIKNSKWSFFYLNMSNLNSQVSEVIYDLLLIQYTIIVIYFFITYLQENDMTYWGKKYIPKPVMYCTFQKKCLFTLVWLYFPFSEFDMGVINASESTTDPRPSPGGTYPLPFIIGVLQFTPISM